MIEGPILIDASNLSYAWARAFILSMTRGGDEIAPLTISIRFEDGIAHEDLQVRSILDKHLVTNPKRPRQTSETVAKTIFPYTMAGRVHSRHELYQRYHKILPRLHKKRANRDGIYFERMISYRPKGLSNPEINQLEKVICDLKSPTSRRSGLQLGIFDPTRDHKNTPYMGFPCLQQIAFAKTKRGLLTNAFYPMQYLYERAYGNYLGLVELTRFIANQASLLPYRVICTAGVGKREITKQDATLLTQQVRAHIENLGGFEECRTLCLSARE